MIVPLGRPQQMHTELQYTPTVPTHLDRYIERTMMQKDASVPKALEQWQSKLLREYSTDQHKVLFEKVQGESIRNRELTASTIKLLLLQPNLQHKNRETCAGAVWNE